MSIRVLPFVQPDGEMSPASTSPADRAQKVKAWKCHSRPIRGSRRQRLRTRPPPEQPHASLAMGQLPRRPAAATAAACALAVLLLQGALPAPAHAQGKKDLVSAFKGCRKRSPDFDACVLKGVNSIQHLFKRGLPELNVAPFDPHHAEEVVQRRGGPGLNYRLTLRDADEFGWTRSFVDRFKSDLDSNRIEYSQYFPEKWLTGAYEMDSLMLQYPVHNKGIWNITLYDYNQTTVIFRRPVVLPDGTTDLKTGPLRVQVRVTHIGNMDLHVSNLLRGRPFAEGVLDRTINAGAWRAGLPVFLPLVNDLVSSAFTRIFDDSFRHFPFDDVFPE